MPNRTVYDYSPLNAGCIRLLQIEAIKSSPQLSGGSIRGDGIRCRIQEFPFSEAPPYRALSYAWGDSRTDLVSMNGRPVEIRKNLWQALWHLRATHFSVPHLSDSSSGAVTEENTKWIWIDALCIDQSNTTERNHQVGMMGSIYKAAVEVLAWLGCREDLRFGSRVPTAVLQLAAFAADDDQVVWRRRVYRFGVHNFLELFALQYWQRMWILQEVRLGRKVTLLFDTLSASWTGLERLRATLGLPDWSEYKKPALSILDVDNVLQTGGGDQHHKLVTSQAFRLAFHRIESASNTLLDLLRTGQYSACADPRDKVYAVLSLANDCQNGEIEIDYSKSLFKVYKDVMDFYSGSLHMAQNYEKNLILELSQMLQESFGRPAELNDGAEEFLRSEEGFERPCLFSVSAIKTGEIEEVHTLLHSGLLLDQLSRTMPHLLRVRGVISRQLEEMSKAIPIDSRISNAPQVAIFEDEERTQCPGERKSARLYNPSNEEPHKCLPVVLSDGRTGYAPVNAQKGDIIFQFPGCEIAAVARSRATGGCEIIGRAFIKRGEPQPEKRRSSSNFYDFYCTNPLPAMPTKWARRDGANFCLDIIALQQLTAATDQALITPPPRPITGPWNLRVEEDKEYDLLVF